MGADTRPFEKELDDLGDTVDKMGKSSLSRLGSAGLSSFGAIGLNTVLQNDVSESVEAASIMQPGDPEAASTIRHVDEAFARSGLDFNAAKFFWQIRQLGESIARGDEEKIEAVTFAGFDHSLAGRTRMIEKPIDYGTEWLKWAASSPYKDDPKMRAFYHGAMDALGWTKIYQGMESPRIGLQWEVAQALAKPNTAEGWEGDFYDAKIGAAKSKVAANRGLQRAGTAALATGWAMRQGSLWEFMWDWHKMLFSLGLGQETWMNNFTDVFTKLGTDYYDIKHHE